MAGAPYAAGGINVTIAATRGGVGRRAGDRRPRPLERSATGPASRRSRSSRATAGPSTTRRGCCASAARLTDETTFLGAHVVPPEYEGRADDYVALVCGEMLDCRGAARPLDRRLLRARRVRRRPVPRRARGGSSGRARACACTPTSSGSDRACSSPSSSGAHRPTTARTSPTRTSRRWPAGRRWRRSSRRRTSRPASRIPDARRVIDAGATVALATNCNPGSSYTTSMSFVIALAVRDLKMTASRGRHGRHARRGAGVAAVGCRLARSRIASRSRRARRAELLVPRLPPGRAAGLRVFRRGTPLGKHSDAAETLGWSGLGVGSPAREASRRTAATAWRSGTRSRRCLRSASASACSALRDGVRQLVARAGRSPPPAP